MKLYVKEKDYTLLNGNMLDMLEFIEPNSVDAIVCDPPYELNFMGKGWDNSGIAFNKEAWEKCFKVLKSGGYLLAFGGSRTYHRIACAIEDAGFEIRDCIMWLYGSGFPKSHDIGLQIDKKLGCSDRGHRIATASRYHPDGTYEPNGNHLPPYEGRTELGKQYVGWGTQLKPAYEPIVMARKPFKGSLVDNVLENGVGGLNIDECRIATNDYYHMDAKKTPCAVGYQRKNKSMFTDKNESEMNENGRFPANVIHDGSYEATKDMPIGAVTGNRSQTSINNCIENRKNRKGTTQCDVGGNIDHITEYTDNGSVSRYFYCAKASKKDRDEGLDLFEDKKFYSALNTKNGSGERLDGAKTPIRKNIHPTVKPIELMQYLIRLVLPRGGTLLDPFMGSGSTGKACMFENRERDANYHFIGIELTDEYLPICKARIDYAINKYEYDEKKEEIETGQMHLDLEF